jgi:glutaredoxin
MYTFRFAVALLALGVSFAAAAASVYKWKDDAGRVHYSNEPPPENVDTQKVRLVIPSFGGPAEVTGVAVPAGRSVVLYGTTHCRYCQAARNYLRERGIPFTDFDVESSAAGREGFRALGGRGVPIILVGNMRMDGFNAGELARMLATAGY